jgi:tetratricopeptide (TPR) repeat protein
MAHSLRAKLIGGLAAIGVLVAAFATSEPTAAVTLTPETVVARLGSGPAISDDLRAAMLAQRADPSDAASLAAARLMLAEGRAAGDSRLVSAALAAVQPFAAEGLPEAMLLAAQAKQYQHDFPGALALLDAVLAVAPNDVNARLNRATIHTVTGDYAAALADCETIARLRADVGFLCQATTLVLTTSAPEVAERLTGILAIEGALDPSLAPWATSLLGEIAMMQGDAATAETHFRAVLADDPGAQRDQLMLADVLLGQGQAAEVSALLQDAPGTDGVLIRRVLAARAVGQDLPDVVATLTTRAQRSLDLGLTAHAREEAMFYLFIADNPTHALERAESNWALQHEYDDARLLILSAEAAGNPAAAKPALEWMRANSIDIPALPLPDWLLDGDDQ